MRPGLRYSEGVPEKVYRSRLSKVTARTAQTHRERRTKRHTDRRDGNYSHAAFATGSKIDVVESTRDFIPRRTSCIKIVRAKRARSYGRQKLKTTLRHFAEQYRPIQMSACRKTAPNPRPTTTNSKY